MIPLYEKYSGHVNEAKDSRFDSRAFLRPELIPLQDSGG